MGWQPGSRAKRRELESPIEGVPAHLALPLWGWFQACLRDGYGYANADALYALGIELRVPFHDPRGADSWGADQAFDALGAAFSKTPDLLLDGVEWLLAAEIPGPMKCQELNRTLQMGNSAYEVSTDRLSLQMRVLPSVRDRVQAVADGSRGSAGDHLASAWAAAYGRKPDPPKAYGEIIKAVECAGALVVSPKNSKATLGTIIADVQQQPGKWAFEIAGGADGVQVALDMMRLLWKGQTSRHGGIVPTRPETLAESRAAVHLGATLMHWFASGAFRTA